jgi:sensor c-di-GMP phosphodiesterase-like protein
MLSELILALPAAILVGLVPGWFWARLLLASSDLPEQIGRASCRERVYVIV